MGVAAKVAIARRSGVRVGSCRGQGAEDARRYRRCGAERLDQVALADADPRVEQLNCAHGQSHTDDRGGVRRRAAGKLTQRRAPAGRCARGTIGVRTPSEGPPAGAVCAVQRLRLRLDVRLHLRCSLRAGGPARPVLAAVQPGVRGERRRLGGSRASEWAAGAPRRRSGAALGRCHRISCRWHRPPPPGGQQRRVMGLFRLSRGGAVWCWMALAGLGGCRPTVLGGVGGWGCGSRTRSSRCV